MKHTVTRKCGSTGNIWIDGRVDATLGKRNPSSLSGVDSDAHECSIHLTMHGTGATVWIEDEAGRMFGMRIAADLLDEIVKARLTISK